MRPLRAAALRHNHRLQKQRQQQRRQRAQQRQRHWSTVRGRWSTVQEHRGGPSKQPCKGRRPPKQRRSQMQDGHISKQNPKEDGMRPKKKPGSGRRRRPRSQQEEETQADPSQYRRGAPANQYISPRRLGLKYLEARVLTGPDLIVVRDQSPGPRLGPLDMAQETQT